MKSWLAAGVAGCVLLVGTQAGAWPHPFGGYGFRPGWGHGYRPYSYVNPYYHHYSHFPPGGLYGLGLPYSYTYQIPQGYQVYLPSVTSGEVLYVIRMPDRSGDWQAAEKLAAWERLAAGEYDEASAVFAEMERQLPGTAWPKVGAGLLAGFAGDYSKSHYQFRRAFRFDPDGPGSLPRDPELSWKLGRMADHFRQAANQERPDADAEFMLAAVSYLAGDYVASLNAIEKAIKHGDDSRSARNLRDLAAEAARPIASEFLR